MLNDILWSDHIQWQPPTDQTFTNLDLIPDLRGFQRTFATGVACLQGTLTPPDTWSRPFGTCICSTCWDKSFFRTCRYFSGLRSSNIPRYFLNFALNPRISNSFSLCWILSKVPKHAHHLATSMPKISFPTPLLVWKIKMSHPISKRKDARTDG